MTVPAAQDYRDLVADLAAAARRHEAALAGAQQSYTDGVASVRHDVAAAQGAVNAAATRAAAAQRAVAQTDLVAAGLWDELRKVRGRRGRRLGQVPGALASSDPDADSIALLESASARIERARRGGEPLPPMVLPLLIALGSAAAVVVALAGVALLRVDQISVVPGWTVVALAPLSGLPPARRWVDNRFLAKLDPGAIGLLILGGMLATVAVTLTLT